MLTFNRSISNNKETLLNILKALASILCYMHSPCNSSDPRLLMDQQGSLIQSSFIQQSVLRQAQNLFLSELST